MNAPAAAPTTPPPAEKLAACEAALAGLIAARSAAPTEAEREKLQRKIDKTHRQSAALAEAEEATALDQLRADYWQLCRDAAAAGVARARAKAARDQAAARYYKAHGAYCAADAIACALERKVAITFALQLAPPIREALAPDMRAARISAGLQQTAHAPRPALERHYAEAN